MFACTCPTQLDDRIGARFLAQKRLGGSTFPSLILRSGSRKSATDSKFPSKVMRANPFLVAAINSLFGDNPTAPIMIGVRIELETLLLSPTI